MVLVASALALGLLVVGPIPQDEGYHLFADQRTLASIPNALNVLSNLPLFLVGALGLAFLASRRSARSFETLGEYSRSSSEYSRSPGERLPFALFFLGILWTGIGSAYYHLAPSSERLFWDRLPMTLAFAALFGVMVIERIARRAGTAVMVVLLGLGPGSALLWRETGDLRLYLYVQFAPIVLLPVLLALFPPRYTRGADYVAVIGWYVLAKVLEVLDAPIYRALGVSGHTWKHVVAAVAVSWLLRMLVKRRVIQGPTPP